jgi:hypothetical protein
VAREGLEAGEGGVAGALTWLRSCSAGWGWHPQQQAVEGG